MMLRTNFLSRIKKACNAALVPRILRGEQRVTPAKFEILSCAAVRKSQKSTKATREGSDETTQDNEDARIVQVIKEPLLEKYTEENTEKNIEPIVNTQRQETQYEKCQRIIELTFGKEKVDEPELTEQYFSHSVDIEQTRQEMDKSEQLRLSENMISDDRTQYAVFKTAPELKEEPEELMPKESMINAELNTFDTDPNEDLILMKPMLNIHLMSARAPDDIIKNTEHNKEPANENLPLEESITQEEVDKYVHNHENLEKTLYETHEESKQNAAHTIDISETRKEQDEPPVINKCTSKIPSLERKTNVSVLKNSYLPKTAADMDFMSDEKFYQIFDSYLDPHLRHNALVNTTTAKEEQEQLTQKVEHIEETPLVEAQKQTFEGFNITPRVLGELEQAYYWIKSKHVDSMSGKKSDGADSKLDEAAKRCLDSPVGQIDETLLNELEKLGIPITCKNDQTRSPVIDDNRVQMNILRNCTKLDQFEEDDTIVFYSDKVYPAVPRVTEKLLPDKDAEAEELAMKLATEDKDDNLTTYPSHIHIDKNYDHKILITKTRPIATAPEAEPRGVKLQEMYSQETAQVNPAQIPSIIEEMATKVLTGVPPQNVSFQGMKVKMNRTKVNEIDPTNRTMKLPYVSEPNEKLKAQQLYARPDMEEAKQASAESKPEESPVTKPWNPFAKPGYRYVVQTDMSASRNKHLLKSYAKGMEKPLYYQSTNPDKMWNPQHKPEERYNRRSKPKSTDKTQTYLSMNLTNKWDQYSSGKHRYTGTGEKTKEYCVRNMSAGFRNQGNRTPPSKNRTLNARLNTADEQMQTNVKAARETNCNKLLIPDEVQEQGPVSRPPTNYMAPPPLQQQNKINSNVSDGIWDENIDVLTSKEKMALPEELMKQQLDPYYVLTCNETCPISPKPTPSHLIKSTKAIYEKPTNDAEQKDSINREVFMDMSIPAHRSAKQTTIPDSLSNLPKLNEDISLSELLRRVRERSRIIECRNELKSMGLNVDPIQAQVGKCPRRAPQCLPTAPRPPKNPIPPPSFGLPQLKRRPPVCKPRRKPGTRKYSACDMDLSPSLRLGPEFNVPLAEVQPELVCEMNNIGTDVCATRLKADLTEEVIEKLQTLGKLLGRLLRQGKAHMFDNSSAVGKNGPRYKTMLARDYAPWAPIPSWPAPKQAPKRKPPCQRGCPSYPPPLGKLNPEPPCNLKPCEGFPKKSFSLIDCFAVSVGENKVYDIGKF